MRILLFISILLLAHHVSALNILGIISMPLRSHYMAFLNMFQELAKRGHNVTFINNYPNGAPTPNLRYLNLQDGKLPIVNITATIEHQNSLSVRWYEERRAEFLHIRNYFHHLDYSPQVVKADCENLLSNHNANKHLKEGIKYDVIFVEQFVSDCGLAYAAAHFDAPIIGLTSHTWLPWAYERMGVPFNSGADPFYFSNSGPSPSLYHKVETAIMHFLFNTFGRWYIQKEVYGVFKKYLPNVPLDIDHAAKERMKMMFSYQHFSITGSRLMSPQFLEVAGVHINKPEPVTSDLEEFLSDAKDGAIYVSFGSNLRTSTMSPQMMKNFLAAFQQIPQKVIWKYENTTFPAGYDNIFRKRWFNQVNVLCHPKVIGFITHGGMLSLSESVHCGKPLLVMPFFGDQFSNAAAISASGLGKKMFFSKVTSENLLAAITELTSPETQQRAKRISEMFHDRPLTVMDSAVYWTEYVARYRSSPPSPPTKYTTWFEDTMLDVVTVIVVLLILLACVSYAVFKYIVSFIKIKISSRKKKAKGE